MRRRRQRTWFRSFSEIRWIEANARDRVDEALSYLEDGSGEDWLRILTLDGEILDFARTRVSEFAGACWSPSPATLYVNLQSPSITLAIWGPWPQLRK